MSIVPNHLNNITETERLLNQKVTAKMSKFSQSIRTKVSEVTHYRPEFDQ